MRVKKDIQNILKSNPGMRLIEDKEQYILEGIYEFNGIFNNVIYEEKIQLRMKIPFTFPEAIPQLYLKDIPDGFSHINPDNSCCVSSYGEIFVFLATKPGIKEFIRAFIDPFIFSLLWFRDYGTYLFGEREHGIKGLIGYYQNDLNLTLEQYYKMVFLIHDNKYRGHMPCICGSNIKLRECHGEYILPIIKNNTMKQHFLYEATMIFEYIKKEGEKNGK